MEKSCVRKEAYIRVYARFIPEEKAEVWKRAALPAEHGVVATVLGLHMYCRNLVWELVVWGVRMGVANRIDPRKLNFCEIFVEDQSVKYLWKTNP